MPSPGRVAIGLLLIAAGCGGPQARSIEVLGPPVRYQGQVVASHGQTMARIGDTCEIEVMRTNGEVLNCRIRVLCGETRDPVYGLSDAGYNRCRVEGDQLVFANDTRGYRGDGDPRLFFDLHAGAAGRVIISDDNPIPLEILVDLIAQPEGYDQDGQPTPPAP
ncbi:MAG: hypothetical protein ACFCGT_21535 [Sandaracinaceae bacterium]